MINFKSLNNCERAALSVTSLLILYSSMNTGSLNFGEYSFILVIIILFGMYLLTYKVMNYISYSSTYISSILVIVYLKSTIYSFFPFYIFGSYLLILFLTILSVLKKNILKAVICSVALSILSFILFSEKQLEVIDSENLFNIPEGNNNFKYLTYSPGEDNHREEYKNPNFISYNLDASKILESKWNQSKIEWRERYWGFNKKNLPLNGRLWIPEGDQKFPIISIIHGNHSMQEHSDDGYNYLGEYLSEHGYIFNSLDQNFLNGSWTGDFRGKEMTTRAWHFLENLNYLKKLNNDSSSILYNKIDFNNIIVMGHSRGGEAVNIASKFNELKIFPDNGNVDLDYNFNIKAIITLAPTDYRYFRNYDLQNINYLSVQGSMDSDEDSFFGIRQANRLENSNSFSDFNILIEGANHSQFNTSWGKHDIGFPGKLLVNNSNILPGWLQRKILKYYLIDFLNYTLEGDEDALYNLKKSIKYPIEEDLYKKIISRSNIGGSKVLLDFEGDELSKGYNSKLIIENTSKFQLEPLKFRGGKSQDNSAMKINISDSSIFKIEILEELSANNFLSFDISNERDSASLEIKFLKNDTTIHSEKIDLDNTKIDLDNYKLNYLTVERFKKRNDINFSTYHVNINSKEINGIGLIFSEGEYYIDNIKINN